MRLFPHRPTILFWSLWLSLPPPFFAWFGVLRWARQDLIAIFGNFGKVISTSLAKDDFDESKGFGVVKVGSTSELINSLMTVFQAG